jgi:hypothetical protein
MRPFTFDQDFNPLLEQPEDPQDFRFNIQQIIGAAKGSQIVLISPIANKNFIAGSSKGNFIFYRIFGIQPDIWPDFTNVPKELHEAFEAEYEGNSEISDTSYRSLI